MTSSRVERSLADDLAAHIVNTLSIETALAVAVELAFDRLVVDVFAALFRGAVEILIGFVAGNRT